MGLETATHIFGLNSAFPTATDGLAQGDDHIRLVKSTVKATFPNFTDAALNSTQAQIDAAVAASVLTVDKLGDGTVGAPTYSYTSEPTTGWYKKSAGVQALAILGTDTFDFSSAGLVLNAGDLNVAVGGLKLAGTNIFPLTSARFGAASVLTAAIADANVTYAKIQNVTASRLLGNPTGSAAAPSEISLGSGLKFSGSTLVAPAVPLRGQSTNKVIKVLTNTTVSVAGNVVVSDGTNYASITLANTLTTNAGVGLDQLDSSTTISAAQWLYVYALYNGTTVKTVASTSATAPDLTNAAFSGYTFYAYLGALRTAPAVTSLLGTWQFGNKSRYIFGLAQTTSNIGMVSGAVGSVTVPTWSAVSVSNFVPTTATHIAVKVHQAGGTIIVAPNNGYGATSAAIGNGPPIVISAASANHHIMYEAMLESTNIYWANDTAAQGLVCDGWTDGSA